VAGRGDDYEVDKDPLAYMTSDYPSPYLVESEINMQRRFTWRALHALPASWLRRRRGYAMAFVGIVALIALLIGVSEAIRALR
jgi:hypothetical protein